MNIKDLTYKCIACTSQENIKEIYYTLINLGFTSRYTLNDLIKQQTKAISIINNGVFDGDEFNKKLFDEITIDDLKSVVSYIPFPVSLSTCDMIGYSNINGNIKILLGKKPKQDRYQFPGGFRDPKETSQEAAKREYTEEANLTLDLNRFRFIKELFIDDMRYKYSVHKVTTSIFAIELTEEEMNTAVAGDDLAELKVFSLEELQNSTIIRDIHINILNVFIEYMPSIIARNILNSFKDSLEDFYNDANNQFGNENIIHDEKWIKNQALTLVDKFNNRFTHLVEPIKTIE